MAAGSYKQHLFIYFFLFFLSIPNALSSEATQLEELKKGELQKKKDQIISSSRRSLNNLPYKTTEFDSIDPPTTSLPITNPVTTPSVTNPVTTPSLNNPPSTQLPPVVTIPATNPINVPNTNPVNTPLPLTNPVTTPSTIPVIPPPVNPVTTPTPVVGGGGGGGGGAGQSWCIAKSGASQTALQAALDYACGIGGADCATIQQGATCYNPISLQNHASYAFNSYYQKNPAPTSCDFGGVAAITNVNPSSGTCVYPSSASSFSTPAVGNPTSIPTPTTSSTSGASPGGAIPGAITPPSVLNSGSGFPDSGPTSGFGSTPPGMNSSYSSAPAALRPSIACLAFLTFTAMGRFILHK